jgi:hypothetical protein
MSTLNNSIKVALAEYLRDRNFDCVEVTAWEDGTKSTGYCETCYYEYAGVDIWYTDSNGDSQYYEYYGSFGELISAL